jgi:hypothetical protein
VRRNVIQPGASVREIDAQSPPAADDADVIAELGRWAGTSMSNETWELELGVVRGAE